MILDIESSGLKADFANCFCFGWMWHGEKKAHIISTLDVVDPCRSCRRVDTAQDDKLMRLVYDKMLEADMIVSWYGKGFDWKFLNTRMLEAGVPPATVAALMGHKDIKMVMSVYSKLDKQAGHLKDAAAKG